MENLRLSKSKALRAVTFKVKIKLRNGRRTNENITINNKTFRNIFSIKTKQGSVCFYPEFKNGNIIIHGKGRGHLMGVCQWGAKKLADSGWNHRKILQFYYPGTKIDFIKSS